jgi:3-methylcrotonyl-CoA carboxylase alpha subunit
VSFEYLRDGHPVRVTLERSGETVLARVDEREVVLCSTAVDERQVRLITADGRHHRIVYAKREGRTYVAARGAGVELAPHSDTSADEAAADGGFTPEIVAPMPGKILEVLVAVGDDVAHDAPLIRMEAMKMEQTIRASAPAKVRELRVTAGAMVGPGAVLLVLDPLAGD